MEVSAGEILKIEVVASDKTATAVTVIYRQPSMRVEDIVHKLQKVLTEAKSKKRHVIMGDFNIDMMKKHQARDDLTEMFSSFGYHLLSPLVPTRVTSKQTLVLIIFGEILELTIVAYTAGVQPIIS